MYPFMTLPVHFDTFIPINHYYSPVLPPVVLHIPADLPFHQPTGSLSFFHLTLHAHLSVNSSAGLHTDIPTRKWMYLLILMIYFWLTKKTFLPTQLIVWMSINTPGQKLYPFIFIHPYRISSTIYPSSKLLLYIYTNLPRNKYTCLSWCFPSGQPERPTCRLNYSFTLP